MMLLSIIVDFKQLPLPYTTPFLLFVDENEMNETYSMYRALPNLINI